MNIMYLHGWASSYDPNNAKSLTLNKIGSVFGTDIDYTQSPVVIEEIITDFVMDNEIEAFVGTSFGGYWAARMGSLLGLPYVAINPLVQVHSALISKIGTDVDFAGNEYTLTEEVVDEYAKINEFPGGYGLILLAQDDDVINAHETLMTLQDTHKVFMYPTGGHRFDFDSSGKVLSIIENHFELAKLIFEM